MMCDSWTCKLRCSPPVWTREPFFSRPQRFFSAAHQINRRVEQSCNGSVGSRAERGEGRCQCDEGGYFRPTFCLMRKKVERTDRISTTEIAQVLFVAGKTGMCKLKFRHCLAAIGFAKVEMA